MRLLHSPTAIPHNKIKSVVYFPRKVMEYNRAYWKPETPIFVMLDEFQNILNLPTCQSTNQKCGKMSRGKFAL